LVIYNKDPNKTFQKSDYPKGHHKEQSVRENPF